MPRRKTSWYLLLALLVQRNLSYGSGIPVIELNMQTTTTGSSLVVSCANPSIPLPTPLTLSRNIFKVKTTSQPYPKKGGVPDGRVLDVTIDFYLKGTDLL